MKIGNLAVLRLYKSYSILSSAGVTKKLTQQYIGPFEIKERVRRLVYKLEILDNWKIYPIFLIAQLEPAFELSDNLFWRSYLYYPPIVFVDGDTDNLKSFEINCLVSKRIIKRGKGLIIEYLIYWTGYGPEQDKWYNVKDLDNAAELIHEYKEGLTQ